ncbi:hypothetical protein B0T21DRAFT_360047 [Apiosordaria backusii]|uniref:Secreted protein n=1 Tax=Apiosordaria backusii TaxID=314023 RepID=A0AA40ELU6_9PEZI|nr:hypothetical protein B0T21DRAFT_360047 [Apiosordaria backusii]
MDRRLVGQLTWAIAALVVDITASTSSGDAGKMTITRVALFWLNHVVEMFSLIQPKDDTQRCFQAVVEAAACRKLCASCSSAPFPQSPSPCPKRFSCTARGQSPRCRQGET